MRARRVVQASITDIDVVDQSVDGARGIVVIVESDDSGDGPNGPCAVHDRGIANVTNRADADATIVLASQIYITRLDRSPEVREVIEARGAGEQRLRSRRGNYCIIRPGWLHDGPSTGVHVEHGDTGAGRVSRQTLAEVCALGTGLPMRTTFELFDGIDDRRIHLPKLPDDDQDGGRA